MSVNMEVLAQVVRNDKMIVFLTTQRNVLIRSAAPNSPCHSCAKKTKPDALNVPTCTDTGNPNKGRSVFAIDRCFRYPMHGLKP